MPIMPGMEPPPGGGPAGMGAGPPPGGMPPDAAGPAQQPSPLAHVDRQTLEQLCLNLIQEVEFLRGQMGQQAGPAAAPGPPAGGMAPPPGIQAGGPPPGPMIPR